MLDWEARIRERLYLPRMEPAREAEIVEELSQHLEDFYLRLLREGALPEAAYQEALAELGKGVPAEWQLRGTGNIPEQSASSKKMTRIAIVLRDFWQDIRFILRSLKKQRSFSVLAILALSLGIGCTTVGFGVVENLLFDPYPYKGANRMATFAIHDVKAAPKVARSRLTVPEFLDYQKRNHVFDDIVGSYNAQTVYSSPDGAETFWGAYVTPNTFEFFDVAPLLGRWITTADGKPGAPPVFVMNYRLWQERFGGDRTILGKVYTINDQSRTLVGIMPPRFQAFGARVWLPITLTPSATPSAATHTEGNLLVLGRLKPSATLQSAAADLTVVAKQIAKVYVDQYPPAFVVQTQTLNDAVMGNFKGMLYALVAAVLMLLLIACSNVANLLLARATSRDKEIAVRTSIGASAGRLVRQFLAESFVLSAAGFAGGCAFAFFGLKTVVATIPEGPLPDEAVIGLNPSVLLLALGITVLTIFLCGLAPALHAMRGDLPSRLASSGRSLGESFRHGKLRRGLVIVEVALSLVLLTGAGLMVRSFLALLRVDLGFSPAKIYFTGVSFAKSSYDKVDEQKRFFQQVLERVQAMPGVNAVAASSSVPALGGGESTEVEVPGRMHSEKWSARLEFCSEDYFRTLGLQLLGGSLIARSDVDSARKVVVINQELARKYFGQENPVGKKIKFKSFDNWPDAPHNAYFEIIGVVADFKNQGLQEPADPEAFLPYTITTIGPRFFLVNTALDPESLMPDVRRAVWAVDSSVAPGANGSIEHWLQETTYKAPRFGFTLLGAFAAIGLVLVSIGVFSVMAYTVSLQTHELGIRMALGAQRRDILRMVLLKGLRLIAAGMIAGLLASFGLTRLLANQIWGISTTDSWTFCAAAAIIIIAGLAACFLPAEKATQVDPLNAIRCE
jgi:predicted permease